VWASKKERRQQNRPPVRRPKHVDENDALKHNATLTLIKRLCLLAFTTCMNSTLSFVRRGTCSATIASSGDSKRKLGIQFALRESFAAWFETAGLQYAVYCRRNHITV